jgi:hypothetical protein
MTLDSRWQSPGARHDRRADFRRSIGLLETAFSKRRISAMAIRPRRQGADTPSLDGADAMLIGINTRLERPLSAVVSKCEHAYAPNPFRSFYVCRRNRCRYRAKTSTTRLISNFPVAKWPRARHFGRRLTASASHPPLCAGILQGATMIRSPSHRTARTGRSNNGSFRQMNLQKTSILQRPQFNLLMLVVARFLCALGAHVVFQVIEKT